MLLNDHWEVVATASKPYESEIASPGYQDTVGVHNALLTLGKSIANDLDISAIALCSTWQSVAALNQDFEPVTRMYTWEYMGAAVISAGMRENDALTSHLYNTTGCMPNASYPRQILMHLQQEKGLDLKDRLLISQGAYSFYKMTGQFAETICTQAGGGFLNLPEKRYSSDVLSMLGIDENQLGRLITYQNPGILNEDSAKLLGIKAGIPVVPAHADGAYNQIGSSCGALGKMTLSVGTSAAMRLATKEAKFSPNKETWSYYGIDSFISGAAINGACNCINWFKNDFLMNQFDYHELERSELYLKGDPPVFLPFLFGERCPGWRDDRRAGFVEVEGFHTPADFYLAIQLGTLFSLLTCYHPLVAMAGEPDEIFVSGGILNSKRWLRMLTDSFEKPMLCVENHNASSLGAAVVALHAAGGISDVNQFTGELDKATFIEPDLKHRSWYQRQFERYLDWYRKT